MGMGKGGWPRIPLVLVMYLPLSACAPAWCQEERGAIVALIEKAWQARQNRVTTASFKWEEEWTWPKGSISAALQLAKPSRAQTSGIMPPTDATVHFSCMLLMDKEKIRFEYDGERWATRKRVFRPVRYLSVFDGKTGKSVDAKGQGSGDWPVAVIRRGESYWDAGLAVLRPLLLIYRPFSPAMHPASIASMTLAGKGGEQVDGKACLELVERWPRGTSLHRWVDPTRAHILLRQLNICDDLPRQQIDVRYRPDKDLGWVPTGWTIVDHNVKGALHCSIVARVTGVEFDRPLAASSFHLEFPLGARVQDERSMEHYILRYDGTKRPILAEDIGATYDQMLKSTPGHARDGQGPSRGLGYVLGSLALLTISVIIWRRVRLGRSVGQAP